LTSVSSSSLSQAAISQPGSSSTNQVLQQDRPPNRRQRILRRLFHVVLVFLVFYLVVSTGLVLAIHTYGQQVSNQTADVIIVLGSGLRRDGRPGDALYRRSLRAAELYNEGYAPNVICTGGQSAGYPRSEAAACQEILENNGVPTTAITLEDRSRSTEENARNSRAIMEAQGWEDAVLVSDSFHMLRGRWIFETQGLTVYPNPVPSTRVRRFWYVQSVAREVLGLQWQALKEVLNLPVTYVPIG
jgi:uncharacterized SAM-binding protein YcdF (DUF218 family)